MADLDQEIDAKKASIHPGVFDLEDLLAGITDLNLHDVVETVIPVGNERW